MAKQVSNKSPGWDALRTAAHAWQFYPDELDAPATHAQWLRWISSEERIKYGRFTTARQRNDYLAARALCRATLSRYTDVEPPAWQFTENAQGKPSIAEPARFKSLRFNLTHTNGLMICLVTRVGEAGVDAEATSRDVDVGLVAQHFLSRRQQLRLARLPRSERAMRFFEQWVLKEAYVKALGKGLGGVPERLTIEQREDGTAIAAGCHFSLNWLNEYHVAAAAVIAEHRAVPVSIEWFRSIDLVGES